MRYVVPALFFVLAACSDQPETPQYVAPGAMPRPIQETVPATTSTIPAQTYYFNPDRAGSAGN